MGRYVVRTILIMVVAHFIVSCSSSSAENEVSFRLADLNGLWNEQDGSQSGEVVDRYIQIDVTDTENKMFVFELSEDDQNCFYSVQINLTARGDNSYTFTMSELSQEIEFTFSNNIMTLRLDDSPDIDGNEIITVQYIRSQGLLAEDIPECF